MVYIAHHFDHITQFARNEIEFQDETAQLERIVELTSNHLELKDEAIFVSAHCMTLQVALLKMESNQLNSTLVYNLIDDLYHWLDGQIEQCANPAHGELFTAAKQKLCKLS